MKKILTFLITIFIVSSLSASIETWIGIGLKGNTAIIAPKHKEYYQTYVSPATDIAADELKKINNLGPTFDVSIFPYSKIPIGIKVANEFLFPVGINSEYHFRTMQGDFTYNLRAGLDYAQSYTEKFGLFASSGIQYSKTRVSKTNEWNSPKKSEYFKFSDYGIYGELGFLTTISNGYFKLGVDYNHSLNSKASSYSMIISGGYRF